MTTNIVNLHSVKNIEEWASKDCNEYIGRPTKEFPSGSRWGNPHSINSGRTRVEVVDLYKQHLNEPRNEHLRLSVGELKGKVLGCWCAPYLCHAEVLHRQAGNVPVYDMDTGSQSSSTTGSDTIQLLLGNLSHSVTADEIVSFFALHRDEHSKANSAVELSTNAGGNVALLHIPRELYHEALSKNGAELAGKVITVKDPAYSERSVQQLASSQFKVSNLNPDTTVESLVNFLGFGETIEKRRSCSVALSACKTYALVVVPEGMASLVTESDGKVLAGNSVSVSSNLSQESVKTSSASPSVGASNLLTLAHVAAAGPSKTSDDSTRETVDIEMTEDVHITEYVTIDTTRCHNPYNVPSHAAIVRAITAQFPKTLDPYRNVLRLRGRSEGIWKIETTNIELYKHAQFLKYGNEELGYIEIKKEIYKKDGFGNVTKERVRNSRVQEERSEREEDDLLITLFQANTERFSSVTNEMILREITTMDVGELKRAPQPQRYKGTEELNGNKFFVLSKVPEAVAKDIPSHFSFFDARHGWQRMWLNHRLRKRYCSFCGTEHDTECPTKALFAKLKAERNEKREAAANKCFDIHLMGDSTLRYVEQECMAVDVHAMSGAMTGNILNAVDVNEEHREVENLIIVSGQNDLQAELTDEEFLLTLKHKEERLKALATEKKVAILKPPPMNAFDPVDQAKEVMFNVHLATMEEDIANICVWPNPIQEFEEDGGRHPTPQQTSELLQYLDRKALEEFGVPLFLQSGPNELITTKKKYGGVTALYKYGCGACGDKSRNKWWALCNNCSTAAKTPEESGLMGPLQVLLATANEIRDVENPSLPSDGYRDRSPLKDIGNVSEENDHDKKACKRIKFCNDQ